MSGKESIQAANSAKMLHNQLQQMQEAQQKTQKITQKKIDQTKKVTQIKADLKQAKSSLKEDKLSLSSMFSWETNDKGNLQIKADTREVFTTSVLRNKEEVKRFQLSLLSYKVDFSNKVEAYKELFVKSYVQARSKNLLMAKFAEFKQGLYGQLLSMLGVSQKELIDMQKKAIKAAIDDNMAQFIENEYNHEMLSIIGGGDSKVKTQLAIIDQTQVQLKEALELLGVADPTEDANLIQIRKKQCEKILSNFEQELRNLTYALSYYYGED